MPITDANIILRYILNDHEILSAKAAEIIENNRVNLPIEVACETAIHEFPLPIAKGNPLYIILPNPLVKNRFSSLQPAQAGFVHVAPPFRVWVFILKTYFPPQIT